MSVYGDMEDTAGGRGTEPGKQALSEAEFPSGVVAVVSNA